MTVVTAERELGPGTKQKSLRTVGPWAWHRAHTDADTDNAQSVNRLQLYNLVVGVCRRNRLCCMYRDSHDGSLPRVRTVR